MKKQTLAFLGAVIMIFLSVSVCLAEESTAYQQAYLDMLEEFDRGNYEDAYTIAKIVYEADPTYEEIINYYQYLTALQDYLPEGKYKEAHALFEILALRQFRKSEGYAAFTQGCLSEAQGKYSDALGYFNSAFSNGIDEALEKIQECKAKSKEGSYSQAAALENQKSYLAAAELYKSLSNDYPDAGDKANECYYLAAEAYSLEGKYEEAANLFTDLQDYKDSAQKAIQNRAWASGGEDGNRLGLRLEESTSTSLTLKWDDETALGSFEVTWMPAGIETQAATCPVNDTNITLDGLLPNTQYTVAVTSPSNTSFYEKKNYWTEQADPVSDYHVRKVTMNPRLLDRASVSTLGAETVINATADPDKCIDLLEQGYQIPDRKPSETYYDTYISLRFFADELAEPKEAEITYIVRLDGKISVGKTEPAWLSTQGYIMFSANLTDLMDVLYDNTGLNGSDLTIEAYMNGQYMGKTILPIGK